MKKILSAITALLCVSAVCTGCGKDDDKKGSKKESTKFSEDELTDVVEGMMDAAADNDIDKIVENMLPDDLGKDVIDIAGADFKALMDAEGVDISEEISDAKITGIKKTSEIDENYLLLLEKGFSLVKEVTDYMKEEDMSFGDIYELDDEEVMDTPLGKYVELFEDADFDSPEELIESGLLDEIKTTIEVDAGYMAEVTMEADGETDSSELPFYHIKGEGWNCDMILYPSMLGYVKKSETTVANSSARALYNSINAVLTELDEEGYDTGAFTSISYNKGDKSVTIEGYDYDGKEFYADLEAYFEDLSEFDFKAECSGGVCIAVATENDEGNIGTYPQIEDTEDKNLDEALEEAIEESEYY